MFVPRKTIITGVAAHTKFLDDMQKKDNDRLATGVILCARIILQKSHIYVPVDTGELKKTGTVITAGKGGTTVASVVYGGEEDGKGYYALYVHEDLTKWHAAPTQAKFLSRAVQETERQRSQILQGVFQDRMTLVKDGRAVT